MGYNTVAVLLNDYTHAIEEMHPGMARAMRAYTVRKERPYDLDFRGGRILSQDHASGTQVVVVHGNTGQAVNAYEGDKQALDAIADILLSRGYAVRFPGETRAKSPSKWNEGNWIK